MVVQDFEWTSAMLSEQDMFYANIDKWLPDYCGKFVAVYRGEVIASHESDPFLARQRAYETLKVSGIEGAGKLFPVPVVKCEQQREKSSIEFALGFSEL